MPTVPKKYTPDVYEGRKDFGGNHDVYEMPEKNKPRFHGVRMHPRTVVTILLLLLFIAGITAVIVSIYQRSQGFT
jgi:hypothetical protein